MTLRDKPIEKKYFTIREVAEMIHQNASTLRFWEDQFDWINPKRDRKHNRKYQEKDIIDIMAINILVNMAGMTLEGIRTAYEMGYLDELKLFFIDKHRNYQGVKPSKVLRSYFHTGYFIPDGSSPKKE